MPVGGAVERTLHGTETSSVFQDKNGNGLRIMQKFNLGDSFWNETTLVQKGAIIDLHGNMICDIPSSALGIPEIARTIERDKLHKTITDKRLVHLS
ncbi:MAG: hypothetical protein ABIO57_03345 [Candidatus Paceibacterota bacterium]